jgi:hypothetical protein
MSHWAQAPSRRAALIRYSLSFSQLAADRRRRAFLTLAEVALHHVKPSRRHPRRNPEYVPPSLPYNEAYWARCKSYGNAQFKRHFRMTKDSFWRLHEELYGLHPPPVWAFDSDFRLGLFLFRMATKQSCREISELFSVSQSSVSRITNEVARDIIKRLASLYIKFPNTMREMFTVSEAWEMKSGFPHVLAAVDGTHVVMDRCPSEDGVSYFSRKQQYGIAMQAVVNHRGVFTSVDIGWPASVHDCRMFDNSSFFAFMRNFIREEARTNPSHRWYVLGDSAYRQSDWMMKPYPAAEEADGTYQRSFNIAHAKARVEVENAFGRLKARWRRMKCLDTSDVATGTEWIHACVVLHNFCEVRDDLLSLEEVMEVEERVQAEHELEQEWRDGQRAERDFVDLITGEEARDGLAQILHQRYLRRHESESESE